MEEGIDVLTQASRQKQSENNAAVTIAQRSSFPSIPIKIPIMHRLQNLSKRKGRSLCIPEDVAVTSKNAPITLYSRKKKDAAAPVTPSAERRKRILEAVDRVLAMENGVAILDSPDKPDKRKPFISHGKISRVQTDGSVDRWNVSFSTMKTADMSESTASSPSSSPHSLGSHKHRIRQSWLHSKSSLDSTPELSSELNDSKQSLTISEVGSKRSITISELGSSFSTRPSSYSTRPPRSSSHLRTSGSSSSHLRTSESSSNPKNNESSSHLRYSGWSSNILPESMGSRSNLDTSEPSFSMRSSISTTIRSSRTEKRNRTDKQLRMAQSSSATSLEKYGKLSKRRSSATQESATTATTMLYEELGGSLKSGGLSSLLEAGEASGSPRQQRTSNSTRSHRSIRSGSRRSSSRLSGSLPSHRQRSINNIVGNSFISTSSSDDDGVSSLEDSPSVEETLRWNLAKAKDQPPQRRRSSTKDHAMDRSLMRKLSYDTSIDSGAPLTHHSKRSLDSSDRFCSKSPDNSEWLYSNHTNESTSISLIPRGSRRTSGNSKRSTRTSGNSKRSSRAAGNSKRNSGATETRKRASPRIKSDAASLRSDVPRVDVPRTIEFVKKRPQNPLDTSAKSIESPKTSSSRSSSSNRSSMVASMVSPISMTSPLKKRSTIKYSSKAISAGASRLFKTKIVKKEKKSKKTSKKGQDQRSSASQASESLPSLFGTALCLDQSSRHNPTTTTTSPFYQYDIALNDAQPQTAIRQRSFGSLSRSKNSFGSLDGSGDEFVLTEEEEGGASGVMTSPSVSLASDFISAASSLLMPPAGLRLPTLQQQKKKKKKSKAKTKTKKKAPAKTKKRS